MNIDILSFLDDFAYFFVDFSKLIQSRFSGRVTNLVRLDYKLVSRSILQRMISILQCVSADFWHQRSNVTLLECVSATNCQFETDTKSFENDTVRNPTTRYTRTTVRIL